MRRFSSLRLLPPLLPLLLLPLLLLPLLLASRLKTVEEARIKARRAATVAVAAATATSTRGDDGGAIDGSLFADERARASLRRWRCS